MMKNYKQLIFSRTFQAAQKFRVLLTHNPRALLLAGIMIASTSAYVINTLMNEARYRLSNESVQIIGKVNQNLTDKLSLDKKVGAYRFNPQAITPEMMGEDDPAAVAAMLASQKQQTGGGGKDTENLYSLDLPIDPSKGTKIYDANSKTSFKLIPEFAMGDGRTEQGRVVYPLDEGGQAVYSVKGNGVKEDIVLSKPRGDALSFSYRLELPKTLEAHLDDRGNLGIYSVDPMVSSAIAGALQNNASSTDTERLKDVQQNGTKTHLTYLIPAPTIVQSGNQPQGHKAKAIYKLNGDKLTVSTSGLEKLTYPISIDPSVVVTSTSEFATGNNEGNISFDTDAISRAEQTNGKVGAWTATTSFSNTRSGHATVAYNGYLYITGGKDAGAVKLTDVQYAPINANGTIGAWTATTSFTTARSNHTSVAYNGYLYILGGSGTALYDDVQYAPINANGTLGTWTATSSFGLVRSHHGSVAYNGYMYVIAGTFGSGSSHVQYAPVNADGTLGAWTYTTGLATARPNLAVAVYNGYLYSLGGWAGAPLNTVEYAPINANGTVGTWTVTTSFTTARSDAMAGVYNGYLYVSGGYGSSYLNDIQYALINANGTVGTWTVTTSFTTARSEAKMAMYNGYVYTTGGLGAAGALNDVQYSQVDTVIPGPTMGMSSWTTNATGLGAGSGSAAARVTTRANHGSVAYNGYIYVVGGTGVSATQTSVHYAPLNANGTVGAWTATATLLAARAGLAVVATSGYMYAVGGQDNSGVFTTSAYYAQINSNGTLGTWTATTSLTSARSDIGMERYNGYMYVTGGITTGAAKITTVEYAVINANGTLGTWTSTTALPVARGAHATAVYNGFMYVIGGSDGVAGPSTVIYAPINANATLGTWNYTTTMSTDRLYIDARIYQGHIFVTGGYDGVSAEQNTTVYAKINANGTIGSWNSGTSFTTARDSHGTEIYNGYIYITGGWDGSTKYGDVQYAQLSYGYPAGAPGTTATSATTATFTTARNAHTSVAYNGYLYVIGGYNGTYQADVQYAPINTDGTVGTWQATTSLPTARSSHASVAYNGYLYSIGGSNGTPNNEVLYAPINSNGTIGSWTATATFSSTRSGLAAAVYNGYLYIVGGNNGTTYYGDVQYAPINTNGTVGTWATTTSFAGTGRSQARTVAYNGYLYVTGGVVNTGVAQSDVLYAPINTNGTVGTWATTSSFTTARFGHGLVAYNGYLYIQGGLISGTYYLDVQFAAINSDGTLGDWTATQALLAKRGYHSAVAYNGYLYAIGGSDTGYFNTVEYAQMYVPPRKAQYTKMIDMGQVGTLDSISSSGSYNNNPEMISFKTAGSNGVFGSWQLASTLSGAPTANVRYVMFKVALDDSYGTASLSAANGRSTVSDITVNYTLPPALTSDNRLRHDKYFDASGVLQPSQLQ